MGSHLGWSDLERQWTLLPPTGSQHELSPMRPTHRNEDSHTLTVTSQRTALCCEPPVSQFCFSCLLHKFCGTYFNWGHLLISILWKHWVSLRAHDRCLKRTNPCGPQRTGSPWQMFYDLLPRLAWGNIKWNMARLNWVSKVMCGME